MRAREGIVAAANGRSVQSAEVVRNRQGPIDPAGGVGLDLAELVVLRREARVGDAAADGRFPDEPHRRGRREALAPQDGTRADRTLRPRERQTRSGLRRITLRNWPRL